MFKKTKWEAWYDAQPEHIKRWIDQPRPLWYDRDLIKVGLVAIVLGFAIGFLVGYESALKPIVNCFKPLIG